MKRFLLSINCLLIVIYFHGSYDNIQIVESIIFNPSACRCLIIGLIKFEFRGKISWRFSVLTYLEQHSSPRSSCLLSPVLEITIACIRTLQPFSREANASFACVTLIHFRRTSHLHFFLITSKIDSSFHNLVGERPGSHFQSVVHICCYIMALLRFLAWSWFLTMFCCWSYRMR